MKRVLIFIMLLVLIFTCSCSGGQKNANGETVETVEDVESLSAAVGIDVTLPATASYVKCSMINGLIGEVEFTYNTIIYVYRVSKINSGESLHGKKGAVSNTLVEIGERATVELLTDENGGRVASWHKDGTNYSVTSLKSVTDDALTELCDLLIK